MEIKIPSLCIGNGVIGVNGILVELELSQSEYYNLHLYKSEIETILKRSYNKDCEEAIKEVAKKACKE